MKFFGYFNYEKLMEGNFIKNGWFCYEDFGFVIENNVLIVEGWC